MMTAASPGRAARAKPALLPVLIEGNARMPLGAGQARRLIALLYARQHATEAGMDGWIGRLTRDEDPPLPQAQVFARLLSRMRFVLMPKDSPILQQSSPDLTVYV